MVFCNDAYGRHYEENQKSHNPYFNRWFSAMLMLTLAKNLSTVTILILIDGFLQLGLTHQGIKLLCVTILILIDGFLQLR